MIKVTILGSSGKQPLPNRYLASAAIEYQGDIAIIDAGEGTQVAASAAGIKLRKVSKIFLTHGHADHVLGLGSLLLGIANAERTDPVQIYATKACSNVIYGFLRMIPKLPFDVKVTTLVGQEMAFEINRNFKVIAFKVKHSTECYGFKFALKRNGKFNAELAEKFKVPQECWASLQCGKPTTLNGTTYVPSMIMDSEREGLSLVYCTDTRYCPELIQHAKNADLLITEGMYGDAAMVCNNNEDKHMTFAEAADVADNANVKELWLTHFSPVLVRPEAFLANATNIFPNTKLGYCGLTTELMYAKENTEDTVSKE